MNIFIFSAYDTQILWQMGGRCMQTSVVIGAFQFIGFHLAKYLLDQGEEVIGIDWEDERVKYYGKGNGIRTK